jgi:hypothetical protein
VLLAIMLVVYILLCFICRRMERAALIAALGVGAVVAAFVWATVVGGTSVSDRLLSLTEERADQVYLVNRGFFLEETINQIKDYPNGAGLGRWGMMANYFGDPGILGSEILWVEIQPTAWLYDGGLLLLIAGYAALAGCFCVAAQIVYRSTDPQIADWAAVIVALDIAMAANTLTYPIFASQAGMTYLMLNGALYAAANYVKPAANPLAGPPD